MIRYYQPIKIAHKLYEAATGSCKRQPIILLHGFLQDKDRWETIAQLLADSTKRKVYAYDARNHGQSEHTMESHFDYNIDDLYHFMDKMKIRESVLVGYNMGGMTAARAAIQRPSRIEAAFILDMHYGYFPNDRIYEFHALLKSLARQMQYCPDGVLKPNLAVVRCPPPDKELLEMEFLKRSVLLFRSLALMDALELHEIEPRYPIPGMYNGPAYFMFGTLSLYLEDKCLEGIVEHILGYFPKAVFERFEGHSHTMFDTPNKLVKFIASNILPPEDS